MIRQVIDRTTYVVRQHILLEFLAHTLIHMCPQMHNNGCEQTAKFITKHIANAANTANAFNVAI